VTTARERLPLPTVSPATRRAIRWVGIAAAVVGVALGLETLVLHATTDPVHDLRIYYDAGARLNAGQPLYDADATDSEGLYLYPPLTAIAFRPLAILPFEVVAVGWELAMVAALTMTIWRAGVREPVVLAVAWLALPILWALSIGQIEPLVTLLLAVGSPVGVALAANLKVFPVLVAIYWLARREWHAVARLLLALAALLVVQAVLEPAATAEWLRLTWLRPAFAVRSISPFAIHPVVWLVFVAALAAIAVRSARTRYGWAAAVALAVLAYPRLLVYQLMSLLAAFGGPRPAGEAHR